MNKDQYESPELDVIYFESEDIITGSNDELPIVPATQSRSLRQ